MAQLRKVSEISALRLARLVTQRDLAQAQAHALHAQRELLTRTIDDRLRAAEVANHAADVLMTEMGLDPAVHTVHVDDTAVLPDGKTVEYCGVYAKDGTPVVDEESFDERVDGAGWQGKLGTAGP